MAQKPSNTNDLTSVTDDPKTGSKECLKCMEKHSGEAIVLMKEISDRFNGKLDPTETHVIEDISDAMKELGALERHAHKVTETSDPTRLARIKQYGATARSLRGQLRNFREEFPQLPATERQQKLIDIQIQATNLDNQILEDQLKNKCTTCQQINTDYMNQLKHQVQTIKEDIAVPSSMQTQKVPLPPITKKQSLSLQPLKTATSQIVDKSFQLLMIAEEEIWRFPKFVLDDLAIIIRGDRSNND